MPFTAKYTSSNLHEWGIQEETLVKTFVPANIRDKLLELCNKSLKLQFDRSTSIFEVCKPGNKVAKYYIFLLND